MPVVSRVEFAEGAGSRLLRVVCAYASEPERTNVAANAMVASFIESAKLQKEKRLKKRTFPSNEVPEPAGPCYQPSTTFSILIPELALIRDLRNGGASMRAINPMFIRAITG
jgi:hypothetical protein